MSTHNKERMTETVNKSGFPLQIALSHLVREAVNEQEWPVLYEEHAWRSKEADTSGFIDLVLESKNKQSVLVVECKRPSAAEWIFLSERIDCTHRKRAKLWVTHRTGTGTQFFGWDDCTPDPIAPEATFCVIAGENTGARPMLERTASELVSATEALAFEEHELGSLQPRSVRRYMSVIVTTADLKVCVSRPQDVSLSDGKLPSTTSYEDARYIRFRKQLSARPAGVDLARSDSDSLARAKEHTVMVVKATAFEDFLMEVDFGPVPPLRRR